MLTTQVWELLGTSITPLKILILIGVVLSFYFSSKYAFVPLLGSLLEKIRIEKEDRDLISKLFFVFLILFGIILGLLIIDVQIMMFFSIVIVTIQTVEVTILDIALFTGIFLSIYFLSTHILIPLLRKPLKKLEIDGGKESVFLKIVNSLVILAGFYLSVRSLSSRLLNAVLSYEIIVFVGTSINPGKIISATVVILITYLVSKYLVVPILENILEWSGTGEDESSTLLKVVHTLIILLGIFGGISILGIRAEPVLSLQLFTMLDTKVTVSSIITFALTIFFVYSFSKFILTPSLDKVLKEGGLEAKNRKTTLKIVHYFVVFLGVVIGFNALGIQFTSLFAVAGVAGIVLGFGLQPIVSNLVSGLLLMGERTVRVGDWVEFGDKYGVIVDTGIRASTVRTLDNRHILVPNSSFAESPFTNYTHQDTRIRIKTSIGVSYESDVEKVREILLNIAEEQEEVLDLPEPKVFFEEFGNSSLNFRLACWISDPKFRQEVKSDLNFKIRKSFKERGIKVPYPQRDLHIKRGDNLTEKQIEKQLEEEKSLDPENQ